MTLLYEEVRTLRKTNQVLIKRRRTKKTRIRVGDILTVKNVYSLIEQKEIVRQQLSERLVKGNVVQTGSSSIRRCKRCDKTNYNVRIYQKVKETFEEDNNIESN